MNERPIIMSAESARAILEGRKTQTRRVLKFPGKHIFKGVKGQLLEHDELKTVYPMPKGGFVFWSGDPGKTFSNMAYAENEDGIRCPFGERGDKLWVRETWSHDEPNCDDASCGNINHIWWKADEVSMVADSFSGSAAWRSPIYMPRWASRMTVEITAIRVERLQKISDEDLRKEGTPLMMNEFTLHLLPSCEVYKRIWNQLNAKRGYGWDVNPWVWVIEFKKVRRAG